MNPKEFLELLALSQIIKEKGSQLQYFDISYNKQIDFNKDDLQILLSIIKHTGLERLDQLHSVDFFNEKTKEDADKFYEEYKAYIKDNSKLIAYF